MVLRLVLNPCWDWFQTLPGCLNGMFQTLASVPRLVSILARVLELVLNICQCAGTGFEPLPVLGLVLNPCQSVGTGFEPLPECWDWTRVQNQSQYWQGFKTSPSTLADVQYQFQHSGKGSKPVPTLCKGSKPVPTLWQGFKTSPNTLVLNPCHDAIKISSLLLFDIIFDNCNYFLQHLKTGRDHIVYWYGQFVE